MWNNAGFLLEAKGSSSPRVSRGFHQAADDNYATGRFVVAPLNRPEGYPVGRETTVCTPDWLIRHLQQDEYCCGS